MEKLLQKKTAQEVVRNTFCLRKESWGLVITDFEHVYYANREMARFYPEGSLSRKSHEESIWWHNQDWIIFLSDEKPEVPTWVNIEFAKEVAKLEYKELTSAAKGHEARYITSRKRAADWYASNERDAYWNAMIHWNPLSSIEVTETKLLYDNGKSIYGEKPIQLWDDGSLSIFGSSERQRYGELKTEVLTLLQYAIYHDASDWCKKKKWRELLSFEGTISEFSQIAYRHFSSIGGYENHKLSYAIATDKTGEEKYLLVNWSWGAMYEDGDTGENLYLFEKKHVDIEGLPRLLEHMSNSR